MPDCLEHMRPRFLPSFAGLSSENAAHRVAVTWNDESGAQREGVFIPRRDTDSWLNHMTGGRIFPGEHHLAEFRVKSSADSLDLKMESHDGMVSVRIAGAVSSHLPDTSCFNSVQAVSDFFEPGSLGFSVTKSPNRFDGLSLRTRNWKVEPLRMNEVYSSYFSDETVFPRGSTEFDCALLMRNITHEWHSEPDLYV